MRDRILLAYSGTIACSAALAWLREHRGDVVALTVDVGQSEDLEEVRARALACGALRAHVVDARDAFAREHVMPALRSGSAEPAALRRLPHAVVARTLAEIAAVEAADAIAHACADETSVFEHAVRGALSRARLSLPVLAPVRDGGLPQLLDYARRHALPGVAARREPHLLIRPAADPARAPQAPAHLDIAFDNEVPSSLNGVPMTLPELIESVSLIAGQYGLGHGEAWPMPGAYVLQAAYRTSAGGDGARATLTAGAFTAVRHAVTAPVAAGVPEA